MRQAEHELREEARRGKKDKSRMTRAARRAAAPSRGASRRAVADTPDSDSSVRGRSDAHAIRTFCRSDLRGPTLCEPPRNCRLASHGSRGRSRQLASHLTSARTRTSRVGLDLACLGRRAVLRSRFPMAATLLEKVWDAHTVRAPAERPDAAVRRPASDPRGHDAAGVRHAARARLARRHARADDRHRRSHRPHARPAAAVPRRDGGGHAVGARAQLPRARHQAARHRQRPSGHRPRHRAGARADAAGDDDRVRRQPHLHARRVRRGGVRDRHVAGARRPGVAVPGDGAAESPADRRRRAGSRAAFTRRT